MSILVHSSSSGCAWCHDDDSTFDPFDLDDAYGTLCRSHVAEWAGTSLSGLDAMEEGAHADVIALGYFDQ